MWWIAAALAAEPECRSALTALDYSAAYAVCSACDDPWCAGRVAWLDARVDPRGGYAGAERLERARHAADPGEAAEIEADLSLSSAVRADAATWLARIAPTSDAARQRLAPWVPLRDQFPEEIRRPLLVVAVDALARSGRTAEAEALGAELRRDIGAGTSIVGEVQQERRVRAATWGAGLYAVGFTAALAPAAARRRGRPGAGAWLLGAFGVAAAALAEAHTAGQGWRIGVVASALLPLHVLCTAAAPEAPTPPFRIGAALATAAVAWLAWSAT